MYVFLDNMPTAPAFCSNTEAYGDGDLASGGSGNDKMYGNEVVDHKETMFGGTGHDIIKTYGGADKVYG